MSFVSRRISVFSPLIHIVITSRATRRKRERRVCERKGEKERSGEKKRGKESKRKKGIYACTFIEERDNENARISVRARLSNGRDVRGRRAFAIRSEYIIYFSLKRVAREISKSSGRNGGWNWSCF